jgi:multidrug resistance efflux pump
MREEDKLHMVYKRLTIFAVLGVLLLGWGVHDLPGLNHVSAAISESTTSALVIRASAEIIPARVANLSYGIPGRVFEVTVVEGDTVKAGQVLAVLDTTSFEIAIASAEAALQTAQAHLALLEVAPKSEDVAVAEGQLAVAEAALDQARAQRNMITVASQKAAIAAAKANAANANAVYQAALIYEFQQRDMDIEDWQKKVNILRLQAAKLALDAAEVGLKQLPQDQMSMLAQADNVIEERTIQRDRAQVMVEGLKTGVSTADLAIAQARVEQAAVALHNAQSSRASASLQTPFDGIITNLDIHVGKVVAPGQIVITLADFSTLYARTTDFSERDVPGIQAGMSATVFIEALDLDLPGSVDEIFLQPIVIGGDVTYPVKVGLIDPPPDLRWGMTAEVSVSSE